MHALTTSVKPSIIGSALPDSSSYHAAKLQLRVMSSETYVIGFSQRNTRVPLSRIETCFDMAIIVSTQPPPAMPRARGINRDRHRPPCLRKSSISRTSSACTGPSGASRSRAWVASVRAASGSRRATLARPRTRCCARSSGVLCARAASTCSSSGSASPSRPRPTRSSADAVRGCRRARTGLLLRDRELLCVLIVRERVVEAIQPAQRRGDLLLAPARRLARALVSSRTARAPSSTRPRSISAFAALSVAVTYACDDMPPSRFASSRAC